MKVHLPNSARLQNIGGSFRRFDPNNESTLEFSMDDRWVAVHPVVLAFTACIADQVLQRGGTHTGTIHRIRSLPYLIRMKLFDYLQLDYGKEITIHEEAGRFIPLQRISNSSQLSDFIVNVIPLLHAEPSQVDPIRYVISELVRNVLEHSKSSRGAFLCAQFFKKSGPLSLGVADSGIGIRNSMSRFHDVPTDWDAIIMALKPGVSGTTSKLGGTAYNAGAGLFFTKCISCASNNFFVLYSGNAMFKLLRTPQNKSLYLRSNPLDDYHTKDVEVPEWNGTVVGVDISLTKQRTFAELMRLIRDSYGINVNGKGKSTNKKPRFT